MFQLPKIVFPGNLPAFYDVDSATAIEQTAKVYKAMGELIEEFNRASADLEKAITENKENVSSSIEAFKICIASIVENYIKTVEFMIHKQDEKIEEVDSKITGLQISYDNISESLNIGGV